MKKMKLNIQLFSTSGGDGEVETDDAYLQFKDLPDTSTPISAYNLNKMQKYIKDNIDRVEVSTQPVSSYVDTNDTTYSTSYINANYGQQVLWTNPNPLADFAAQTITLKNDNYDILEIYFRSNLSVAGYIGGHTSVLKGYGFQLDFHSTGGIHRWSRRIVRNSDTSYSAYNCSRLSEGTIANDQCVPLYIIGYKTGLFDN